MNSKKLNIIIVWYNEEKNLPKLFESFKDYEIIVILIWIKLLKMF